MSTKTELTQKSMTAEFWKLLVSRALVDNSETASKLSKALEKDLNEAGFEYYYLFVGSNNNDRGGYRSQDNEPEQIQWQNVQVEASGWFYRAIIVFPTA